MVNVLDDLALAHRIADDADALTLARFRASDLRIDHKADHSEVTDADLAVEDAARRIVAAARPGDAVHGEERADTGSGPRRWIIDPIDGTANYARGVPVWATLIALAEGDEVVASVVSAPALHRRWWAARGHGAWAGGPCVDEGSPIHVSTVSDLREAFLSYSSLYGWDESDRGDGFAELMATVWRTRAFGDFWSYMLVAEGVVDLAAEPELNLHDMAALDVIVREAGGTFTTVAGQPGPWGPDALASNGLLHEQAMIILGSGAHTA